jgi:hypothetical protein
MLGVLGLQHRYDEDKGLLVVSDVATPYVGQTRAGRGPHTISVGRGGSLEDAG